MKRALFLILLGSSTCSASFNGYGYQKLITVLSSKVPNSDQTNFPVLISTTDVNVSTTSGSGGKLLNSSGFDVGFYSDSNCSFALNWDTETFNASTGNMIVWVRVPSATHISSATIYECYGDASRTSYQGFSTGTWDANYVGVYHYGTASSLSLKDSTGNHNDYTNHGIVAGGGQINGCATLGIGSAAWGATPLTNLSSAKGTIEWWEYNYGTYNDSVGNYIWGQAVPSYLPSFAYVRVSNNNYFGWISTGGLDQRIIVPNSPANYPTGGWYDQAFTYSDVGNATLYINGVSSNTASTSVAENVGATFNFANVNTVSLVYFDGALDEFRISNIVRSADWLAASYNNQSSPNTFITIGTETASPSTSSTSNPGVTIRGGRLTIR